MPDWFRSIAYADSRLNQAIIQFAAFVPPEGVIVTTFPFAGNLCRNPR
jgi:hypothetical protein